MERIDPAQDREEFEKRIRASSNFLRLFSQEEILTALLDEDTTKLDEIRAVKTECEAHIQKYLTDYDNAAGEPGKRAIVGSVKAFSKES